MSNYRDAILAEPGLIHFWQLGDDANDSVGTAHGTPAGGPQPSKLGRLVGERATVFDGSDDTITVGRPSDLVSLLSAWTIEALVNIPAIGAGSYGFAVFTADGFPTAIPMSLSIGGQANTRKAEAAVYLAPPADPTIPLRSQPGEYLRFDVTTAGSFTFTNTVAAYDTYGAIYDAAGSLLASDDDAAGGGRWTITRTLSVGTYWIAHTAYSSGRGPYSLLATVNSGAADPAVGGGTTPAPLGGWPAQPFPPGVTVSSNIEGGTGSWVYVTGATTIPDATWTRLMATYDGSVLKVYVDGVLDGTSGAVGGSAVYPIGAGLNWRIGRRWDVSVGGRSWYLGSIQHIAVYNRALSATENSDHQTVLATDPVALLGLAAPYDTPPYQLKYKDLLLNMPLVPAGGGGGDPEPGGPERPDVGQTWPR